MTFLLNPNCQLLNTFITIHAGDVASKIRTRQGNCSGVEWECNWRSSKSAGTLTAAFEPKLTLF